MQLKLVLLIATQIAAFTMSTSNSFVGDNIRLRRRNHRWRLAKQLVLRFGPLAGRKLKHMN